MKDTNRKCDCGVGGLVKPNRTSRSGNVLAFNRTRIPKVSFGEMGAKLSTLLPHGVGTLSK